MEKLKQELRKLRETFYEELSRPGDEAFQNPKDLKSIRQAPFEAIANLPRR